MSGFIIQKWMNSSRTKDPIYRFMEKFKLSPSGCWLWTATVNGHGYAHLHTYVRGKPERAHVWIWEQINGKVPQDKELHHICEVKHCVNPSHLRLVTHAKHMRSHMSKTCKRGHKFDYIDSEGKQACHICEAMTARERRRNDGGKWNAYQKEYGRKQRAEWRAIVG